MGTASVFSVQTFFLFFIFSRFFFFLSSSFRFEVYSFAIRSLAPVIRFLCFFEAAASSDGGARMSARSTATNPAATRGFTPGERTGVVVALGYSYSPVQPPPF